MTFFLNQEAITQLDEYKAYTRSERNAFIVTEEHINYVLIICLPVGSNPYIYDRCYLGKFSVMKKTFCSPSAEVLTT